MTENSPTVVVSRRVQTGSEREAQRWFRRIIAAASHADGYVHAEVQPPAAEHPGEWVVVYQFANTASLNDWVGSGERSALVAAGAGFFEGEAREQVLATSNATDPVTAVASFAVLAGHEHAFAERYLELRRRLAGFDGYIRCELFDPVPGMQDETIIVFSFTSRRALDDWLESSTRREMLASIDPHLDGGRTVNIVAGFGGWFSGDAGQPVKRWKQAALVLLALFPTALLVGELRGALLPDVTGALAVFIGNVAGVAVLSWLLMPFLTRRFAAWLHR